MGLDIVIPVILIVLVVPLGLFWAKRYFKENVSAREADVFVAPSDRLTSTVLRELESPPWRVVYEVPHGKLGGIAHVLIGPAGIFALRTTMDPMPAPTRDEPDARAIGESAIARGLVDDALGRCAMSADRLVLVHWGPNEGSEIAIDLMPAVTAVDGRELHTWVNGLRGESLTPSQVDLAWQTVVTAIGRPDPLR
jgi:hypothetical protein